MLTDEVTPRAIFVPGAHGRSSPEKLRRIASIRSVRTPGRHRSARMIDRSSADGGLQGLVDDHIIEFAEREDLLPGLLEAAFDRVRAVGPSRQEPAPELPEDGRHDEDQLRREAARPDLPGALDVDVQDDVAGARPGLDLGPGRPVAMAVDLRPFDELAARDHGVEPLPGYEMIFAPVDLGPPLRPRRVGHGEPEVPGVREDPPDERRFPASRRAADDEHHDAPRSLDDVRGVLADALQLVLDGQALPDDPDVLGLRARRVGLPADLLGQEIQLLPQAGRPPRAKELP